MDPATFQAVVFVGTLILLYAMFSAVEVALVAVRKARLKQLEEEGHRTAALIERLSEDSNYLLATSGFGRAITGFTAVASAAIIFTPPIAHWFDSVSWLAPIGNALAIVFIVIVMTWAILVFGQFLPKRLAHQYAEPIAFTLVHPFNWFALLSWPVVSIVMQSANWMATILGANEAPSTSFLIEEEIRTIVDAGEEEGIIEEDEKEMIYSIFEFGDTLAREIMVPRIDILAVEVNTPLLEALDAILAAGHSRIPVYSDTIDNIVGLLYAKDLLTYLRDGKTDVPLSEIVRPAYFVPESKKVKELLEELQQRKVHMAIVVDEYGGTAGLVTIEDILEEIVGEIQDEYDKEESTFEVIAPGEIIFNARVNLDDVNKLLGVDLPHEGGDTLGGLIYSELGRVPVVQDEVVVDGVKLTVLSVTGRRIRKVKATRLTATEGATEASVQPTNSAPEAH